ncbi:MAG TPA: hypothetical protein VHE59_09400 [Mucilaginibacter sp.]|nr:hypothetical protein [Mucilaginibacter sp.]
MDLSEKVKRSIMGTNWDFGNQVLYDLCEKNPDHQETRKIVAKIWLIGRAYAASIERQKDRSKSTEEYYQYVAKKLIDDDFDSQISSLKNIELNVQTLPEILNAHSALNKALAVGVETRPSFCSKYLHFHFPKLFFLYDSRAHRALRAIKKSDKAVFNRPDLNNLRNELKETVEKWYPDFFLDCYLLKEHINKISSLNNEFTCRHLDNLLLYNTF